MSTYARSFAAAVKGGVPVPRARCLKVKGTEIPRQAITKPARKAIGPYGPCPSFAEEWNMTLIFGRKVEPASPALRWPVITSTCANCRILRLDHNEIQKNIVSKNDSWNCRRFSFVDFKNSQRATRCCRKTCGAFLVRIPTRRQARESQRQRHGSPRILATRWANCGLTAIPVPEVAGGFGRYVGVEKNQFADMKETGRGYLPGTYMSQSFRSGADHAKLGSEPHRKKSCRPVLPRWSCQAAVRP